MRTGFSTITAKIPNIRWAITFATPNTRTKRPP
jgi:hypothetical protein